MVVVQFGLTAGRQPREAAKDAQIILRRSCGWNHCVFIASVG